MCHKEMLGWHSFSQLLSDTTATSLSHNASGTAQVCVCYDTALLFAVVLVILSHLCLCFREPQDRHH